MRVPKPVLIGLILPVFLTSCDKGTETVDQHTRRRISQIESQTADSTAEGAVTTNDTTVDDTAQPVEPAVAATEETESGGAKMASVHPAFHITMTELAELTRGLPETIRARIQKDPFRFFQLVEQVMAEPPELLWLVDKQHALPSEYEPDDLVPLVNYQDRLVLNRNDLSLRQLILPDLFDMVTAAEADDVTLDLSSTYRSYEYQAGLFQRNVEQLGLEQAERESARPGTSQHQLGTTIDFGSITPAFAETTAGKWLAREAWRFGFSMSYPEGYEELTGYMYESWHFRYIGVAAANLEQEFFGGIQQHLLEFWHNKRETLREMSS